MWTLAVMSLITCGVLEFCREKFKFSPFFSLVVLMSFFSSRQYEIFPELFYTLLWNPLKHQTTPLFIELHFDPFVQFLVILRTLFIYLSMSLTYYLSKSLVTFSSFQCKMGISAATIKAMTDLLPDNFMVSREYDGHSFLIFS